MKNNTLFLALFFLTFCFSASGQQTITGFITDAETGEGLIGANILAVGTGSGTATSIDGSFVLKLSEPIKALEVTYTGYGSQTISIDDKTTIVNVKMVAGENLDDIIVIGYGTVKKSDATGAISSIKPEDDEVLQYDNFQNYLQGRAAGVYIQSSGAELGAPNSIKIRGTNSLRGDNEPLYVVDGIIVNSATEDAGDPLSGGSSYLAQQNGLTGINAQDIESVEILKDASATAIYGSRGANGVILITTKKGKSGKAKVNYKFTSRVGKVTNLIPILSSEEYVGYQNDFRALQGFTPIFHQYADGSIAEFQESAEFMEANADSIPRLSSLNWYDEILENSFSQTHRVSLSGGTDNSSYYLATGISDAKGVVPGTRATSADVLFNFNQELSDRVTLSPRISFSYNENQASKGTENLGSANANLIRALMTTAPLEGYSLNRIETEEFGTLVNEPSSWIEDYNDDSNEFRTLASLKMDYKINDIFTYRFLAGGDYRRKKRQLWYGTTLQRGNLRNGEAGISLFNRFRYNVDNTLLFKKKLGKRNQISGTVGVVLDGTHIEESRTTASDFANKDLRYDGIGFGQVFQPLRYDVVEEGLLSFLGRVNYTLKGKYLFTVSFRSDGTSKFAEGNKFSFFPSAAFAWKMINEDFLKNNNLFSEAKLRIGYGRTGSQAIQAYQTLDRFGPTGVLLSDGNGNGVTSIIPLNLANPNLIWETTDQANIGFDFGFKNDRITGSLDAYYKQTYDLLQELSVGPSSGFSTIITNQGNLINKGIELGLTANILEGEFKWTVSGTISFNRNEINDLGLPPTQFGTQTFSAFLGRTVSGGTAFKVPANIYIEGQPTGVFWGYETSGIVSDASQLENAPSYQGVDAQLGDVYYVDQNEDGNINDLDLTIIGDPNPDFNYGIGSNFSYKGVSLNFFFNGVQGNEIANGNLAREGYALGTADNVRSDVYLDAWSESNTDGAYARLGYPLQGDFTDRLVEDGSFLRLTYVSLGYDLPIAKNKKISAANIFVSGNNLLLITNYSGFDPEVNSFANDPLRQGIDWASFPNQKSVVFGLNVTF